MKIDIWTNKCGTFTVRIGNDFYEMSRDANMPNGVNIYLGNADEPEGRAVLKSLDGTSCYHDDIPRGMFAAILNRYRSIVREED